MLGTHALALAVRCLYDHPVWMILTFLLVGAALAWLLARDYVIGLVIGTISLLLSLIYSPFVRVRLAIIQIADGRSSSEAVGTTNLQYLLGKFFGIAECLLVLLGIASLAGGLVGGCERCRPDKSLREQVSQAREYLKEARKEQDKVEKRIRDADKEWGKREDRWRQEVDEGLAAAEKTLQQDQRFASQLDALRRRTEDSRDLRSATYAGERLQRYAGSQEASRAVVSFAELSFAKQHLRAYKQPDYEQDKQTAESIAKAMERNEETYREMKRSASFRFGQFLEIQLGSIVQFIVFVWAMGLAIEVWRLGLAIATDVHAIRHAKANGNGKA